MSISDTIKELNKKYGNVVSRPNELADGDVDIPFVSTGIYSLDKLFGCGGMPRGRIVEVYGQESSGKSTLALFVASIVQKTGGSVLWVDAEACWSAGYAKQIGVDLDKIIVASPETMEEAFDIMADVVSKNEIELIVLDSVAALVPKAELEGDMEDQQMALGARLMGKALRRMTGSLAKTKISVIFLNQLRDRVGVFFGNKHTTPGGNSLKFFASVRIEVKRGELIKDKNDSVIGNKMNLYAAKNKVGSPFKTCSLDLYYAKGVDVTSDLFDIAVASGVITKSGNTYQFGDVKMGVGHDNAKEFLSTNGEILEQIKSKL